MKKEKKSHFNLWIYVIITVCILSSSIAYSALNATLKITGDVTIAKAKPSFELSTIAVQKILNNNQINEVYVNSSSAPPFDDWYTYDVSVGGDESVKAAIYKYGSTSSLYITANDKDDENDDGMNVDFSIPIIVLDCDSMFEYCTSLLEVSFGSAVDFSQVTSMYSMFSGCENLTTVSAEGSHYEAPKLKDMNSMFYDCYDLTYMFWCCHSIETVDLEEVKVATNLKANSMFSGCSSAWLICLWNADFSQSTAYTNFFTGVRSGVIVYVLDVANITWFNNRLSEAGISGAVKLKGS